MYSSLSGLDHECDALNPCLDFLGMIFFFFPKAVFGKDILSQ
jgi:hypothetical protein